MEDNDEFFCGFTALRNQAKRIPPERRTHLMNELFPYEKTMRFHPRYINLGFLHTKDDPDYRSDANQYNMVMDKSVSILVLGKRGSGKTVLMRRMGDMFHHSGYAVVYLSDVKDEMKSSIRPTPDKFAKLLDPRDVPKAMEMSIYRPAFFTHILKERLPKDNKPLSIAFPDLSEPELQTALHFDGNDQSSKNKHDELSVFFNSQRNKPASLEDLYEIIQTGVKNTGIRDSMQRAVRALIAVKAFTSEPVGNIVEDLREGKAVVINMSKHEQIGKGFVTLPQLYISIIMRLVVEARYKYKHDEGHREGRLGKKVVFLIDEAPEFLKPGSLTYSEFERSVNLYRQLGVSLVFASQVDTYVPESIINQCRYFYIPNNIHPNVAWKILQNAHFYRYHPYAKQELVDKLALLRVLPDGRPAWLSVDTDLKQTRPFFAYPALSAHTEE